MSELHSVVPTTHRPPARSPSPRRRSSDEALMVRSQRGDTEAFGRLYDRHARLTLGLTRQICGPDLAEDAVQWAFLSAWNGRRTFSPEHGDFRAWICRISRNRALDLLRAERVHRSRLDGDSEGPDRHLSRDLNPAGVPEQVVESAEDEAEIRAALLQLPVAQREVIVLAYFAGLTHSEIADALGKPRGTIKGRARLGLTRLRRDPRIAARALFPGASPALRSMTSVANA
jgi:RNA polymerase sigma-70 factor (ECF subfamily)